MKWVYNGYNNYIDDDDNNDNIEFQSSSEGNVDEDL